MVPLFLSVASRWVTRVTSRGTVHVAVPAALAVAALVAGGWGILRRGSSGSPGVAATAPGDTTVVFGPQRYEAPRAQRGNARGGASHFPTEFRVDVQLRHRYVVRVTNGHPDRSARVLSGTVEGRRITGETGVLTFEIAARAATVLDVRLDAQATPGHLTLEVLDVTGGSWLVFGMERFDRGNGPAAAFTRSFTVGAGADAPYFLWIVNGNADGSARLADVSVELNGVRANAPLNRGTATAMVPVTPVRGRNELQITLPDQGPGFVEIGITATDVAPPVLTVTAPPPGLLTRDTVITVAGTVSGRSSVAVSVNGRVATLTGNRYTVAVPLTEGDNALAIAAVNAAGTRTDSARVVVRDRTAPQLTVTAPAEGFDARAGPVNVTGTVTDRSAVTVTANGLPLNVDAAGRFSGTVPVAAGAAVVAVTATDAAQNGSTVARVGKRGDDVITIAGPQANLQTDNTLASDNFNRSNETPLGGDWTASGMKLASNRAEPSSLGADGTAYYSDITWPDNQFSRAKLYVTGTGGEGQGAGLLVRRSSTAVTHYRLIVDHATADNVRLDVAIAGSYTELETFTQSWSDGDVWELRAVGLTLKALRNGVQVGTTVIDSSITSGSAGIAYGETATAASIDDWAGGTTGGWSNEPAAFVAFKTTDFTSLPIDGWDVVGTQTIVTDAAAPVSETDKVIEWEYETSLGNGDAPGTVYDTEFGGSIGTHFVGFHFKFSDPFDIGTIGTTLWGPLDETAMYAVVVLPDSTIMVNVVTPEPQGGVYNLYPNESETKVTFDEWHKLEVYFKQASSPTAEDGILRWWVDGELVGDYSDVMWPGPGHTFDQLQIWPGWGGSGSGHPAFTGYLWMDHVYLSRPRDGLPPDPATVATPINPTVATTVAASTAFLYEGENPIQTGVEPGTIHPLRAAVLRGRVLDRDGDSLPGIQIRVLNHPEYGQTLSRADGKFDLAVNGGGRLTLRYTGSGVLEAQRSVDVPWQDYVPVEDVRLVALDTAVTEIDFSDSVEVARGSVVTDADGTRRGTLLFKFGTEASMIVEGDTQPLSTINVRVTEYTVGPNGPAAMPGPLPPASAYTYAAEFSADEAIAAGATTVLFSTAVPFFIENFLGFPVGTPVPMAAYDRTRGEWIPSQNGLVIEVVGDSSGFALLDITGDSVADDASMLGVNNPERQQIATLYDVGQELWRIPVKHFTPHDPNPGFGLTDGQSEGAWPPNMDPAFGGGGGAIGDQGEKENQKKEKDDPCKQAGSIVECENQTLGEQVSLVGTGFTLNYRSDRVPGRQAARELVIPLSGDTVSPELDAILLEIRIAGQVFRDSFPADPNQETRFVWDGTDAYGRTVIGVQPVTIRVSYMYPALYRQAAPGDTSFGLLGGDPLAVSTRIPGTLDRVQRTTIGGWDARGQGLGGWTLNVHHAYDPAGGVLYQGDGTRRSAFTLGQTISTVAGNGADGYEGDSVPATSTPLSGPNVVAVGPDGCVYIADTFNDRVRKVCADGLIRLVAGNGTSASSGDGGQATSASLNGPGGLAVGPDGAVYIAEFFGDKIRRVGPDGIISTVAGTGTSGFNGDGHRARDTHFRSPYGLAFAPDGALYVSDFENNRVRRIGPDSIVTTWAGTDSSAYNGDSILATTANLLQPAGIAVSSQGDVYIADYGHHRVRRVAPDGIITTVAGVGTEGSSGDGGPAIEAGLDFPNAVALGKNGAIYIADFDTARVRVVTPDGIIRTFAGNGSFEFAGDRGAPRSASMDPIWVAVGPDGVVYVADVSNQRIRAIKPTLPSLGLGEMLIASEDGTQFYRFNAEGRHESTIDALTASVVYEFTYSGEGLLTGVTDAYGSETVIERDGEGVATAITGPFGDETALSLNDDGFLVEVTNPATESVALHYAAGGLLDTLTTPRGHTSRFAYDSLGRLTSDEGPTGASLELERTDAGDTTVVEVVTAEGRTTTYRTELLASGEVRRLTVDPAGMVSEVKVARSDSLVFVASDSTRTTVRLGADPRAGLQAPITQTLAVRLPSNLTSTMTTVTRDSLSDPADPLSLVSSVDSVSVNGNVTVSTYTVSNRRQVTATAEGREFVTRRDSLGRVITARVATLDSTMFSYDSLGRLEEQHQGGRIATYSYGPDGRLASVSDPLARVTKFEYDSAGRVTTQIRPDSSEILFAYDSAGNLTSLTPPGRPAHGFQYNAVGLVTQYDPPTIGGNAKPTKYFYNLDRQIDSIVRPDSITVALSYDAAGRPNAVTFDRGTLTLGYSSTTGNPNRIRTPEGDSLLFSYDGSLPTQVRWSGVVDGTVGVVYDTDLRVISQTVNGADTVHFTYDDDGLLIGAGGLVLGRSATNGLLAADTLGRVRSAYQYSSRGELNSYRVKHDTTTLFATGYVRDSLGRIVQLFDTTQGTPKRWSFVYDSLGRLAKDSVNGAVFHVFTYDANGNRVSYTSGAGTVNYSYDNQDRLVWARVGTDTTHYTHGSHGELKAKSVPGVGTTTYSYDALGNLISVVLADETMIEYVIDGQNRRVGRKVDGVLVQSWLYLNQLNPVAELDSTGAVVSRFIYGSRANVPDFMIRGDSVFRLVTDHLGSVRLVVDTASGTVVQRIDYDEWGNVTSNTNPGFQPFGFAGGVHDMATGLVRFGARDYGAVEGRWTAKDPIQFHGDDANLYGYSLNDPINNLDPSGLGFWSAVKSFVRGAVTGAVVTYAVGVAVTVATVAASPVVAVAAGVVAVGVTAYGAFELGKTLYELATDSDWSTGEALECGRWLDEFAGLLGGLVGGGLVGRGFQTGKEFRWNRKEGVAPFGNRTGHPRGELPHYHRRIVGPDGTTVPGGSPDWHRPWEHGW